MFLRRPKAVSKGTAKTALNRTLRDASLLRNTVLIHPQVFMTLYIVISVGVKLTSFQSLKQSLPTRNYEVRPQAHETAHLVLMFANNMTYCVSRIPEEAGSRLEGYGKRAAAPFDYAQDRLRDGAKPLLRDAASKQVKRIIRHRTYELKHLIQWCRFSPAKVSPRRRTPAADLGQGDSARFTRARSFYNKPDCPTPLRPLLT